MRRDDLADMVAFVAVAEEKSFTRAAARIGISQSALSQVIRRLEDRVGVRLLRRTTRSVETTEAGEEILATLGPALQSLDEQMAALGERQNKLSGSIRINTVEHAAKVFILPALQSVLSEHPEISLEIVTSYELVDIVADRFDAGVRLGEHVAKDMISVRISPDVPMAVVGSPAYFESHPKPRDPERLVDHHCINLRLPTSRSVNAWRFAKGGRAFRVAVNGPFISNDIGLIRDAAQAGVGLAYLPLDQVKQQIEGGQLVRVLKTWMQDLPGYHLYYPHRRLKTSAFSLIVDTLRRSLLAHHQT